MRLRPGQREETDDIADAVNREEAKDQPVVVAPKDERAVALEVEENAEHRRDEGRQRVGNPEQDADREDRVSEGGIQPADQQEPNETVAQEPAKPSLAAPPVDAGGARSPRGPGSGPRGVATISGRAVTPLRDFMKTIILAGGAGTRLSEETVLRPKPMLEIGEHPILWHIMQIYAVPRLLRVPRRARLQGRRHQGLFPELLRPQRRRDRAAGARRERDPHGVSAGLDGPPRRHRPRDADRRAAAAALLLDRQGDVHDDLRRRRRGRRPARRSSRSTAPTGSSRRSPRSGRPPLRRARPRRRTAWPRSPRSRRSARAGSTAASSCSSRRCSI